MLSMPQLRLLPIIVLVVLNYSHTGFASAQILPPDVQVRDHVNGLRSAALSSPLRATSIVAIEISAGTLNDTDATPGLAHLAEHILLRHRVHSENSVTLRDFITLHGGRLDAKTSYNTTRFYFEINNKALPTLLQSLHRFLSEPDFSNPTIASEIAAINDEFAFLKTKLSWRLRDALKPATSEHHPFRRFSAGNFESFSSRSLDEIKSDLSDFFRNHYSAAKMSVLLVSPDNNAQQQHYLNDSFGKLPSSNLVYTPIPPLFDQSMLPLELAIRENVGSAQMQLLLPLNGIPLPHARSAIEYLKFWSESEGAGSWHSQLLATDLLSQITLESGIPAGNSASISLSITPTKHGMANTTRLINTVVASLRALLSQAQAAPLYDDFLRHRARDQAIPTLIDRDFAYQVLAKLDEPQAEKAGMAPQHFLFGENFKARIHVDNTLRIMVHGDLPATQLSPVFSVPYSIQRAKSEVDQGHDIHHAIALSNFSPPIQLHEMTTLPALARYAHAPDVVLQTPSLTTWHSIGQYRDEELLVRLSLDIPDTTRSLRSRTLGELWYEALKRASQNTDAKWYQHSHGVGLQLRGDIASLQKNLHDISMLLGTGMSESEFSAVKADLIRDWKTPPSYRFAFQALVDKLREVVLRSEDGVDEKVQTLQTQDLSAFDNLHRSSLQSLNATMYIYGATRAQAELLSRSFAIQHRTGNAATVVDSPSLDQPEGPADTNDTLSLALGSDANALLHFQEAPNTLPEDDAKFRLLLPLIKRQYFSSLREDQKLAYGVTVVPVTLDSHKGLALIAQSSTSSPNELQHATRQFLRDFPQWLNTLPESRFEQLKISLADELLPQPLQGEALAEHYWSQIASKRSSGDWNTAVKNALSQIDREELSQYFDSVFGNASQRSLILQGWPAQDG